jgi:hypothetical protein
MGIALLLVFVSPGERAATPSRGSGNAGTAAQKCATKDSESPVRVYSENIDRHPVMY